jgi:hypothetical protein
MSSCSIGGVSHRGWDKDKGTHNLRQWRQPTPGGMIATMQTPTPTPRPPNGLVPNDPGSSFTTGQPIDHVRSRIAVLGAGA